jgi:hypothetical protein
MSQLDKEATTQLGLTKRRHARRSEKHYPSKRRPKVKTPNQCLAHLLEFHSFLRNLLDDQSGAWE